MTRRVVGEIAFGSETSDGPQIGDWELARNVSEWIEVLAISIIAISVVIAMAQLARSVFTGGRGRQAYSEFKRSFSTGVLLGLDLLIAADIIRTVTLDQTLENVAALGLLVVVRTFLAWSLVLEADGRWPWQQPTSPQADVAKPDEDDR